MKEDMDISRSENTSKTRKRQINKWGVYIGIIFVILGILWYGVNIGLIPFNLVQKEAGPIVIILIGLLILIRSL
jgi:magnesium-transporting ATPase (P-type)